MAPDSAIRPIISPGDPSRMAGRRTDDDRTEAPIIGALDSDLLLIIILTAFMVAAIGIAMALLL